MRVQFEVTDTFGGEANYSWFKRTELVLPDGTTDRMVVALARQWAGWSGKGSQWEKMGGNDDIRVKPYGLLQVMFITFPDEGPDGITVGDVLKWAEGIRAALGTEDKHRVTEQEATLAEAIWLAQTTIGTPGEPLGEPTGGFLARAVNNREAFRRA